MSQQLLQQYVAESLAKLAPELAEVLSLVVRVHLQGERVLVTLPNPIWGEVFGRYAAAVFQRGAEAQGWRLSTVVVDDAASGEEAFSGWCEDPGNRLALAACRAVLREPGLVHNPLYLHGPPGCGKSHLLHALVAALADAVEGEAVLAVSGDEFVTRWTTMLAAGSSEPLTARLRQAVLIACDGIDALCGHALAQEQFFLLLERALERGQQVVVTGRQPPQRLPAVEERLSSRLAWGLVVEIEPPQLETRIALLRRLSPSAAALDEQRLTALVQAWAPDMHAVCSLASRLERGEEPGHGTASFDRVVQLVAERFGVRPGDIVGPRRSRHIAQARQAALLLGRRCTSHSLTALGGLVGGRDHATVLYSIRQAEARLASDPEFARTIAELARCLGDRA